MPDINKIVGKINRLQANHRSISFLVAVIKKYSDDKAGQKAALLTYYGFLSLFPLLLIVITITDTLVGRNTHTGTNIINGLTNYFPLLGSQLTNHVHQLHAGGLAFFAGIIFLLYGARGVASTFINSVQSIWYVPADEKPGFPTNFIKSLLVVIVGGFGLTLASIIAGIAASGSRGIIFRIVYLLINGILLFVLFSVLINYSLPTRITIKQVWPGAAIAAIGLVILQLLGGYILAHELKRLDALYSYFALALGLLSWIYLQSQVIYYALEISVIGDLKLWPRSLVSANQTDADAKIRELTKLSV